MAMAQTTDIRTPAAAAYLRGLAAGDWDELRAHYAPEARVDVTVPEWHFSFRGIDAIIGWLREASASWQRPFEFSELRVFESDGFVAISSEARGGARGEDGSVNGVGFRQSDILVLRGGKIIEHIIHCGGGWSDEVFARIEAEAPKAE